MVNKLLEENQIILLQEHWLFQAQIHMIGELSNNINYAGKGVDINEQLLLISMPRGYGGVAVLWRKDIDHTVKALTDGNERIQCIEITGDKSKLLLMSAYLPAKGCKDHIVEYQETIDQLFEIIQKYNSTHQILIGGDINEDLNHKTGTVRNNYVQDFISDCNLTYSVTGKTFVNSCGQDSTEIDYFLHNIPGDSSTTKEILYGFLFRSEIFFRTTQELAYLFFLSRKARIFFPKFNIRLYDKNSESDYFFFLHQNQNIFFSNIGNQNIFLEKTLQVKWSFPYMVLGN